MRVRVHKRLGQDLRAAEIFYAPTGQIGQQDHGVIIDATPHICKTVSKLGGAGQGASEALTGKQRSSRRTFSYRMSSNSILKFFQVDIIGMFRMTSSARYCKEGVGSSRPNWRWIICFLERPKANTSCKALREAMQLTPEDHRTTRGRR